MFQFETEDLSANLYLKIDWHQIKSVRRGHKSDQRECKSGQRWHTSVDRDTSLFKGKSQEAAQFCLEVAQVWSRRYKSGQRGRKSALRGHNYGQRGHSSVKRGTTLFRGEGGTGLLQSNALVSELALRQISIY